MFLLFRAIVAALSGCIAAAPGAAQERPDSAVPKRLLISCYLAEGAAPSSELGRTVWRGVTSYGKITYELLETREGWKLIRRDAGRVCVFAAGAEPVELSQ